MEIQFHTTYYLYVVTNNLKSLLRVEVTANLTERLRKLAESKEKDECKYLVYFEVYQEALDTVNRELRLSDYSQRRLRKLVEDKNPDMRFLNEEWLSDR